MNKDELRFKPLSLSELIEEESDFFPLLSQEDEDKIDKEKTPKTLPILPLRNTVLFPGVIIPITIGRDRSIKLVKDTYKGNRTIGVLAQKDPNIETPEKEDLNKIGTVAHILKMLRMPDGNITAIIQGRKRFEIEGFVQTEPYFKAKVNRLDEKRPENNDKEFGALVDSVKD